MLIIRREQMAVFEEIARRQFEEKLVLQLEADFPTAYDLLGKAATRNLVTQALETGRANGIVTKSGVTALAGLMMLYGTSFERSPEQGWALGMLGHPRLPEQLKIGSLLERMAERADGRVVVEVEG